MESYANTPDCTNSLTRRWEIARKGILPPTFKVILEKCYPLPVRQSPVLPHPEIPSCSSSLPCTEPESSGDGQTESDSLGAPVDEPKEEQPEIPLAVEPEGMTGKPRDEEKIPLEREHFSKGKGKVVPKRTLSVLKSPSACKGLERPEELHLEMQQTVKEGKMMPKRKYSALKLPPANTRLDNPESSILRCNKLPAVDGVLHADCTKSTDKGENL